MSLSAGKCLKSNMKSNLIYKLTLSKKQQYESTICSTTCVCPSPMPPGVVGGVCWESTSPPDRQLLVFGRACLPPSAAYQRMTRPPSQTANSALGIGPDQQRLARSKSDVNTQRAHSSLMRIDFVFLCMWPCSAFPLQTEHHKQVCQHQWALSVTNVVSHQANYLLCSTISYETSSCM